MTTNRFDTWTSRRLLCDWQMPDFLPELEIDTDYFIDRLAETGARVVEFTAKSAFGNALYPTAVGRRNPGMAAGRDIFGEVCEKAKARGIEVMAYFNVLLDYDISGERENWLQRDPEGNPLKFENYPMYCMSPPKYRAYITEHIAEVAVKYDIDGVMLDIQYWHARGCYCGFCADGFRQETGRKLEPEGFGVADWLALAEFQRRVRREFLLSVKEETDSRRPGLQWTWNGSGNYSTDHELDEHISFYGSEAHPPAYDLCSAKAKWIRSTGRPFELWMPESIGSWGHHTVTTEATIKATSALALAAGGAVNVNHAPVPSGDYGGRVQPAVYDLIGKVFRWVDERETLCTGKMSIAETAILHSEANTLFERTRRSAISAGFDNESGFPQWTLGQAASQTCAAVLDHIQIPYDFIRGEHGLRDETGSPSGLRAPGEYGCIVLPNVGVMSEETAEFLRSYVADGGALLSFYTSSLLDNTGRLRENFLLSDVLGVDFNSIFDFSAVYLDRFTENLAADLPDIPLLFKDTGYQKASSNRALVCETRDGAETLAKVVEPIVEADWSAGRHIFHDHAPPGRQTDYPGIVMNRYGKGVSIFIAVPLLESYALQPNPWYRAVVRRCLSVLNPSPCVIVDGPVTTRVSVAEDDEGWLLHLIRIEQETGGILIEDTGHINAVCRVRPPWPVAGVRDAVTGEVWDMNDTPAGTEFQVKGINCHTIIRVQKEEAGE